jgi:8-oxo-dGTP diphosphatase
MTVNWPDRSTQRTADQRCDATYAGGMRVPCVGAVILDPDGRLLLIRRSHPPAEGAWSIPGGRVEPGESDTEALAREVLEETGLAVTVGRLVGTVDRDGPGGMVYEIRDYACTVTGGLLAPGDDACDARWVSGADLAGLPLTTGLVETLREWGVLS